MIKYVLMAILLIGCTNQRNFRKIEAPPDIPTSYYHDSLNDCSYKSIESNIEPILDKNGNCISRDILNLKYRNIRFKTIENSGIECEYVLAIYENGKSKRIKSNGEPMCSDSK